MAEQGAYGQTLAEAMKVKSATSFVTSGVLRASKIAVTEIVHHEAERWETAPMPPEDGLLVMAQMRDWPKRVLWEDGKSQDTKPLKAGAVTLFDLRKVWHGVRFTPVHYLCFYLPRTAINEIGALEGVAAADEFPNDYLAGNDDAIVASLARALLPAFARPGEANHLFVDHVASAVSAHVLKRYGGAKLSGGTGKLSQRQSARAEEVIAASLDGAVSIATLAGECGLTPSDFVRAFEATTGFPPHQWLLRRRIERAMDLMRDPRLSMADISARAGFASPAHLRRALRSRHALDLGCWQGAAVH